MVGWGCERFVRCLKNDRIVLSSANKNYRAYRISDCFSSSFCQKWEMVMIASTVIYSSIFRERALEDQRPANATKKSRDKERHAFCEVFIISP
jgi:hypothetical protein